MSVLGEDKGKGLPSSPHSNKVPRATDPGGGGEGEGHQEGKRIRTPNLEVRNLRASREPSIRQRGGTIKTLKPQLRTSKFVSCLKMTAGR